VDARDLMVVTGYDAANVRAVTEKRALLVAFLRREAVALQWAHGHPADYAQMLARETGMPLAITKEVAAKNAFLPVPLDAGVEKDLQQVFDTYAAGGALVARRPLADAFVPLDKS
jgi:sulfonate transport system substrate-binding protein